MLGNVASWFTISRPKTRVTENWPQNQTLLYMIREIVCIIILVMITREISTAVAAVFYAILKNNPVGVPSHLLSCCHKDTQPVPMVCLPGPKINSTTPLLTANLNDPCSPSTSNLQKPCLYQHKKRYSPHPRDMENHCHSRLHPLEIHGHQGIHHKRGEQPSSCCSHKQSSSLRKNFQERSVTVIWLQLLRHGLKQERPNCKSFWLFLYIDRFYYASRNTIYLRFVGKIMHLEKPKRFTVWKRGSIIEPYLHIDKDKACCWYEYVKAIK